MFRLALSKERVPEIFRKLAEYIETHKNKRIFSHFYLPQAHGTDADTINLPLTIRDNQKEEQIRDEYGREHTPLKHFEKTLIEPGKSSDPKNLMTDPADPKKEKKIDKDFYEMINSGKNQTRYYQKDGPESFNFIAAIGQLFTTIGMTIEFARTKRSDKKFQEIVEPSIEKLYKIWNASLKNPVNIKTMFAIYHNMNHDKAAEDLTNRLKQSAKAFSEVLKQLKAAEK